MFEQNTLANLPPELQTTIAEELFRPDLFNLALTCVRLRRICLPLIYCKVHLSTSLCNSGYQHSRALLALNPSIRHRLRVLELTTTIFKPRLYINRDATNMVFGLELPNLRCLLLSTNGFATSGVETSECPQDIWTPFFAFLSRHPTLRLLRLDFGLWVEYQEYTRTAHETNLHARLFETACRFNYSSEASESSSTSPIVESTKTTQHNAILPKLRTLYCDVAFLASLARACLPFLGHIRRMHIIDTFLGPQQNALWAHIAGASSLLRSTPVVSLTYLPDCKLLPEVEAALDRNFAVAFAEVRHLSMNLGEGYSDQEEIRALLRQLDYLFSLSIPSRIARDFISPDGFSEHTVWERDSAHAAIVAAQKTYDVKADEAFCFSRETRRLAQAMFNSLDHEDCMVERIILHSAGWTPMKLLY